MKCIQKLLVIAIGGIIGEASAMQVAPASTFDLPAGTPGRQVYPQGHPRAGQSILNNRTINGVQNTPCEHVAVPNTDNFCHIYFPTNGVQPTTEEVGRHACARIADNNVTDWYVRAFGGDTAVALSRGNAPAAIDVAPQMGFKENGFPAAVIRMEDSATADFERQFWQTFRTIASDPVGKVLLYRILIEIRRKGQNRQGSCEIQGIAQSDIFYRNNNRSIKITFGQNCFNRAMHCIKFKEDVIQTNVLKIINGYISTERKVRSSDIGLFHEMLHWFHHLRHPTRHRAESSASPSGDYNFLSDCYYFPSTFSESFAWGGIKNEEIRTILGSPDYRVALFRSLILDVAFLNVGGIGREMVDDNVYIKVQNKFLNGDDLSENVYRMSRHNQNRIPVRMRWGHSSDCIHPVAINNNISIEPNDIFNRNRFCLANVIANDCYIDITDNYIKVWELGHEATES